MLELWNLQNVFPIADYDHRIDESSYYIFINKLYAMSFVENSTRSTSTHFIRYFTIVTI